MADWLRGGGGRGRPETPTSPVAPPAGGHWLQVIALLIEIRDLLRGGGSDGGDLGRIEAKLDALGAKIDNLTATNAQLDDLQARLHQSAMALEAAVSASQPPPTR